MDLTQAEGKMTRFIASCFARAKRKKALVGLSGGLDSSVTLALCVSALGRQNVIAVLMPSHSTPERDLKDARGLAAGLGIRAISIDIEPILSSFGPLASGRLSRANLSARVRMSILYSLAQENNGLVVGTGDKSEFLLGYFTKYGDGGADLFPIGDLYKTQVRKLGQHLGLPSAILRKPPSPALWPGHTAEGELGFSYKKADRILAAIEKGAKRGAIEKKFGRKLVAAIIERMEKNRHKGLPAPICRF